ncbi:hypothetical protein [Plesiocystis pacifica]|uniref:hypothetical protein n=1 Tax=Plesiocystis pacifica TaxID=191768 RepID=UPI000311E4FD|nr:hypothetical protein [Plesiocystis pacifica]
MSEPSTPSLSSLPFFESIRDEFKAQSKRFPRLLNIPTWGYQGSGKTCSILTAIHFCDIAKHGVSLAVPNSSKKIRALEENNPAYKVLGLVPLAETTRTVLSEHNELFVSQCRWPPGTDAPSSYLLEARSVSGKLGYILLPDIMGGSYEKSDSVANNALEASDAVMLLVDPYRYQVQDHQGKNYRDHVVSMIHESVENDTPLCVMLTKYDACESGIVDDVHKQLAFYLDGQESDGDRFEYEIFRVSVISDTGAADSSQGQAKPLERLPPIAERSPDSLVRAWVWTLHQALTKSEDASDVRSLPQVDLGTVTNGVVPLEASAVPEFRLAREKRGAPGRVLCSIPVTGESRFVCVSDDLSRLIEVSVDRRTHEQVVESTVTINGMAPGEERVTAAAFGRNVFCGPQHTEILWLGSRFQGLSPVELPLKVSAWVPVSETILVGVASDGSLYSFGLNRDKWDVKDYAKGFVGESEHFACAMLVDQTGVLVHDGSSFVGIKVDAHGRLGHRFRVAKEMEMPDTYVELAVNGSGYVLVEQTNDRLYFGDEGAPFDLGKVHAEAPCTFALSETRPMLLWVDEEGMLRLGVVGGSGVKISPEWSSAELSGLPSGMCWDYDGEFAMVTFDNGQWAWGRHYGL